MNFKRWFFGGLATTALGFLWVACSSTATGNSCVLGVESCSCTADGQCDPGLSCLSQRCVKTPGPSTGAAGSAGSAGAAATATTTGAVGSGVGGSSGSGGSTGTGGSFATGGTGGTIGTGGLAGSGGAGGSRAGAGGGAGTGGAGGSGGSGNQTLGAACKATGDCMAGLTCMRPVDNLSASEPSGVGNGICTADCTINQSACGPLGGICLAVDAAVDAAVPRSFCFESCNIGPNPATGPAKCHARQDAACEPVNTAETLFACVPLCVTDADCGTRKCDPSSGFCVTTPTVGKTIGAGCTLVRGVVNNECAGGLCLPIESIADGGTSTPGICTALCRLGSQQACGFRTTPLNAGPPAGACVLPWGASGYDNGDLGLCLQLCDSTNDCTYKASNWTCRTDISLVGIGHFVCLTTPAG